MSRGLHIRMWSWLWSKSLLMLGLVIVIGLSSSCKKSGEIVSYSYQPLEDGQWDTQDSIIFNIDTLEHTGIYKLSVGVRTTNNLQFQKIFVTIEQNYNNPRLYRKDTIAVGLTDAMGSIEGDGIGLYDYMKRIKQPIELKKGQCGTVRVSHIMRRTNLSGIKNVGIKLSYYEDSSD